MSEAQIVGATSISPIIDGLEFRNEFAYANDKPGLGVELDETEAVRARCHCMDANPLDGQWAADALGLTKPDAAAWFPFRRVTLVLSAAP